VARRVIVKTSEIHLGLSIRAKRLGPWQIDAGLGIQIGTGLYSLMWASPIAGFINHQPLAKGGFPFRQYLAATETTDFEAQKGKAKNLVISFTHVLLK